METAVQLDELKCVSTMPGALFVVIGGHPVMLMLHANNLDFQDIVSYYQ